MLHLVCVVALILLGVSAASAQDRGALAIDEAAGRYALSLDGEADAVNMCGTTGCKVVATFSSCLGVAHSSPTQGQAVWTWFEADTAVVARREAFDECQRAGGPACAGLNVICLTDSGRRDSGAAAAAQLPPEIQADRYLLQAEQAVRDGDAASARAAMERLGALEREHGLEPAPEDHYRYAQAWEAAGEPQRAPAEAVRYLQLRGREAEHYTAALELMNRAESGKPTPAAAAAAAIRDDPGAPSARRVESRAPQPPRPAEQGRPSGISAGQTCAGQAEGAECWKELASHPGCHVWDDHYYADQTVTWTGGCSGGLASGTGTLKRVRGSEANEHSGLLQDGKRHGRWVVRFASGTVLEGPYVDGKRHGRWVERRSDGDVAEGSYVDGKLHGRWVLRDADGGVTEGSYVDGKLHGRWVMRLASGAVLEGPYVDGKKHGRWVRRNADGDVTEGSYVDGKEHGRWVTRFAAGTVLEGPYVDGKRHGRWVWRWANGTVEEETWVNGEEQ